MLHPEIACRHVGKLNPKEFSQSVYEDCGRYFERLKIFYGEECSKSFKAKNDLNQKLVSHADGAQHIADLERDYTNHAISDFVKNKGITEYTLVEQNRIIEKSNPIFNLPTPTNVLDYRAHFFAPYKQFAGLYFETCYFNVAVIWAMSLILYLALYFRWLPKTLALFARASSR